MAVINGAALRMKENGESRLNLSKTSVTRFPPWRCKFSDLHARPKKILAREALCASKRGRKAPRHPNTKPRESHHPNMQQSGEHAADNERPLREDWEAITDDSGRTYFWNTQTDEVTWNRIEATAPRDYVGPSLGGQGDPCTACGEMVFLAERRAAGSAPYHADCFRCKICAKKLLTDWEADPEGALFCQVHFNQQLMAKGMPSSRRSTSAET